MQEVLARPAAAFVAASRLRGRLAAVVERERGRFVLWLPVAMGAGVVADLNAVREPAWWLGLAAFGAGCVGCILSRNLAVARALCACVAAAGLGCGSAQWSTSRAAPLLELPRRAVMVTGAVREVEPLPEGQRVLLDAPRLNDDAPLGRRLRIRLRKTDAEEIVPGDTLRLRAMVGTPSPPAYPGGWDLQRDAFFAGIGGYGFALSPATVLDRNGANGPAAWLHRFREAIAARISAAVPGVRGAIAATLMTGFTSSIPEADKAAFRDSGLAHLLAIAGLHIGIVMGLVLGTTRRLLAAWEYAALRWPAKQISVVAALVAGGAYMLMTGSHVPIMRSFAMACLVALGTLIGRRAISVRGLAVAGVVIMLIAPNEVLGVSFQLSFSAVLALIAGYETLRERLRKLHGDRSFPRQLTHHVATLALTSALAGTASAPFGAYHFGRFQIYYVLANMLAVPITAFWVMPLGLVSLALMPVHGEVLALAPMTWGIAAIMWIGRTVSSLPAAVLAVPHISGAGLIATSIGLAWLGIFRGRVRLFGAAGIVLGLLSPLTSRPPDILMSADGRLIAVRTAQGAFIEARQGGDKFVRESWAQYWAEPSLTPLPADGNVADETIFCTPSWCSLRPREDGDAAFLIRGAATRDACAEPLLLSSEPIRLRCGTFVPWIDRFSVWREGAFAVWLDPGGPRILSDREARGERPWMPPPP